MDILSVIIPVLLWYATAVQCCSVRCLFPFLFQGVKREFNDCKKCFRVLVTVKNNYRYAICRYFQHAHYIPIVGVGKERRALTSAW